MQQCSRKFRSENLRHKATKKNIKEVMSDVLHLETCSKTPSYSLKTIFKQSYSGPLFTKFYSQLTTTFKPCFIAFVLKSKDWLLLHDKCLSCVSLMWAYDRNCVFYSRPRWNPVLWLPPVRSTGSFLQGNSHALYDWSELWVCLFMRSGCMLYIHVYTCIYMLSSESSVCIWAADQGY